MKAKFIIGIMLCLLFSLPLFCAGSTVSSTNTTPYWAKPKSFWTPANAQKQLREDTKQAVCVRIYGGGKLWHTLTGLSTDAEVIKHSRLDPEAKGILIQNKQLIRLMPNLLCYSGKVLDGRNLAQADALGIEMCGGVDQNGFDDMLFLWWHDKAYCYRPKIGALELKPGNGKRFNNFVRLVAQYARKHSHGISFYRHNLDKDSPT
jgi:hypothetical protein